MQDVQARTIYEGLKGRNGRNNLLEEFLVALHVAKRFPAYRRGKDPVKCTGNHYRRCDRAYSQWLGLCKNTGRSRRGFSCCGKNAVTTREFDQGNCQIHYQILPQYLHVGRNFGSVRIRSLRQEFVFL